MIEILQEKADWRALVESTKGSDFYHTYDYHQLSKNDDETPVLIAYSEDDKVIALPLLIRKIKDTPYFDATSVYGYSGPISQNIADSFDNSNFRKELLALLQKNKIISVFSRLNPFVSFQEQCLAGIGEIQEKGIVVNIDLTLGLDVQKQQYKKRLRTYINKARRDCNVIAAKSKEEVLEFIDIYYENMERVNAQMYYFFKKEYFFKLLNGDGFDAEILLAKHRKTKEIVAGVLFVRKNGIVQYHLSGVRKKYLDLNPVKLIIDEMRIRASKSNYIYLNLGGGLGSHKDSLFKFKSGFSKDHRDFKLWKFIVDEQVYGELVIQKQSMPCHQIFKECKEFFPCYRCTSQKSIQ